jgi:hypothetical protein
MKNSYPIRDAEGFKKKLENKGFVIGVTGIYPEQFPENYPYTLYCGEKKHLPFACILDDTFYPYLYNEKHSGFRPFQLQAVLLLALSNIEHYLGKSKSDSQSL